MSEAKPPGVFARAEAGARSTVIVIGAGIMAFIVGGVVMSGMAARLADRVGDVENPTAAFLVAWALQRVWLWGALPAVGWAVGRFLSVTPRNFALTASLSGEIFGALLTLATGGLEMLFLGWLDLAMRLATFGLGVWFNHLAVAQGQRSALVAQGFKAELTAKQKTEYAAFLARSEGKSDPP